MDEKRKMRENEKRVYKTLQLEEGGEPWKCARIIKGKGRGGG